MHDRKGDGRQGNAAAPNATQNLPADYSEWVSQKVCEIGLPNSQEEAQAIFPFARVLAHRTNRAKRVQNRRLAAPSFAVIGSGRLAREAGKGVEGSFQGKTITDLSIMHFSCQVRIL